MQAFLLVFSFPFGIFDAMLQAVEDGFTLSLLAVFKLLCFLIPRRIIIHFSMIIQKFVCFQAVWDLHSLISLRMCKNVLLLIGELQFRVS